MTLKERLLKNKSTPTGADLTYEEYLKTPHGMRHDKFLNICDRLTASVDLSDIHCSTYAEVFTLIEQYHIDISDIVPANEYEQFKNDMLTDKVQCCFPLGKLPDKIYDFSKEKDRIEYLRNHEGFRI